MDASRTNVIDRVRELTEGRGADAVILAVGSNALIRPAMDAARPGGRDLSFAQTPPRDLAIDPAPRCVDDKRLHRSYTPSLELKDDYSEYYVSRHRGREHTIRH